MDMLKLGQIAEFCGFDEFDAPDVEITGISRDNRKINKGDIFIAIKGERFDGHDYIHQAVESGAAAVVTSREIPELKIPQLIVPDTVKALGDIARGYRKSLDVKVVGITGSVGKTTTKEMVASVLSQKFYTHKTPGNFNNDIGMPLSVLGLNASHQAAVIEMGTNHFGEISKLSKIACPDIAVITAIGESHLEFLGSKQGVLKAKLEILDGLNPNGTVILNGDDPLLWELRGTLSFNTLYYGSGNPECDVFGVCLSGDIDHVEFSLHGSDTRFIVPCGGEHNMKNALCAISVAKCLGISEKHIADGLMAFVNTGMRQRVIEYAGFKVINDCYNASPDSMRAALALLCDMHADGRRIAVLGDMLELGERGKSAHYETGKTASGCCDLLFSYGAFACEYKDGAESAGMSADLIHVFPSAGALANALVDIVKPGDTVLVKGSRGTRMERIVNKLIDEE